MGLDQGQLIHELQVHEAELEMQYEELMAAHAEAARTSVRYQRLYELAPVGCVTVDRSGRVQESNLRAAILFGVAHSELAGKPLQKLMPELAADIFHRHLRIVFSSGTRQTCRVMLERRGAKTGSFPVRIESIVVPDDGKEMLCQSVLINVSEDNDDAPDAELTSDTGTTTRLEAAVDAVVSSSAEASIESSQNAAERLDAMREQRDFAERILTTAPVIVLVLDLDGAIVRFNRCFEELTGYRLDEMRGANWLTTFLPEGDHESARAAFARTLRGEITPGTITPIRTKRGGKVHVEWHNTWIRDARANVCGSLSIGLDITRRRQPGKP